MGANLFKTGCKSCIGQIAQDELDCLGVDVASTNCTSENVAPCGQDLTELLELYPVFDLDLPFNENGNLFEFQDRVLFVGDNGYSVTLRQALTEIRTYVQAVQPQDWEDICTIKLGVKYENRTLFDLVQNYKPYEPKFFAQTWSNFNLSWAESEYKWSNASYRKQFLYRSGERFRVLGPCEETMCVYLVIKDLEVTDRNIEKYATFISDPEYWVKILCVETGFNSCLDYQRKKTPFDLYKVVNLSCDGNGVEQPIQYVPEVPLLNDLVYTKDSHCRSNHTLQ